MRNYLLGVVSGLSGAALFANAPDLAWYFWLLFVVSIGLIVFSFDVFFGSRAEHQVKAGWVGLVLFGGAGAVSQLLVWTLGV